MGTNSFNCACSKITSCTVSQAWAGASNLRIGPFTHSVLVKEEFIDFIFYPPKGTDILKPYELIAALQVVMTPPHPAHFLKNLSLINKTSRWREQSLLSWPFPNNFAIKPTEIVQNSTFTIEKEGGFKGLNLLPTRTSTHILKPCGLMAALQRVVDHFLRGYSLQKGNIKVKKIVANSLIFSNFAIDSQWNKIVHLHEDAW